MARPPASRFRKLINRIHIAKESLKRKMGLASSRLCIALVNNTTSNTVYAYVTGQDAHTGAFVLLEADGKTPYYPESPSADNAPLAVDCGIPLGAPGSTTKIFIPQIVGGRIWFCVNNTLTFLLNPGPNLVEPSVSNKSDPNYAKNWGFCEFTFNSAQLFANITSVDFVGLPISLTLTNTLGVVHSVGGLPADGLQQVCNGLLSQHNLDQAGWDQLIVYNPDGSLLRALSPNNGIVLDPSLFEGYYNSYVTQVWNKYTSVPINVNTQTETWGVLSAQVLNNLLVFPGIGPFSPPSAADIFSCSTGPFAQNPTNTEVMGIITARLAAAFNRSTLLIDENQPDGEVPEDYYLNAITNHYARIVHSVEAGGNGYAFPYDDVGPEGGADVSGSVSDGAPKLLTIGVGGPLVLS